MKTFKDLYERKVNVGARKKASLRMTKLAKSSAFQMKKKRSALKLKDTATIMVRARKKIKQEFRDKFYPNYKSMSLSQRVLVDTQIETKYGAKIAKKALKMLPQLKKDELIRVKAARAAYGNTDK